MQRCTVISNVFEHGTAYGKKGDEVVVPDHIATAHSKPAKGTYKPALKIIGPFEKEADVIPGTSAPATKKSRNS